MAKTARFYMIVCGAVAAVVAIGLIIFFTTRGSKHESPALEFRPIPSNNETTLIWYNGSDSTSYKYWVDSLKDFLKAYKDPGLNPKGNQNVINCDYGLPPPPGKVCAVDVKQFDPCTEENLFGYHRLSPCVFLKLEEIPGWTPEFYNTTESLNGTIREEKMPSKLQEKIKHLINQNSPRVNTIWVTCDGETPADRENIGPLRYYPDQGFPGYYFPYRNDEGYLSPLVAVHFVRPRVAVLINVECKAWARNLKHNTVDNIGSVHFELMND